MKRKVGKKREGGDFTKHFSFFLVVNIIQNNIHFTRGQLAGEVTSRRLFPFVILLAFALALIDQFIHSYDHNYALRFSFHLEL